MMAGVLWGSGLFKMLERGLLASKLYSPNVGECQFSEVRLFRIRWIDVAILVGPVAGTLPPGANWPTRTREVPAHGRPARRQPSGVIPWARRKDLTK